MIRLVMLAFNELSHFEFNLILNEKFKISKYLEFIFHQEFNKNYEISYLKLLRKIM
jgi:hypothetical protein